MIGTRESNAGEPFRQSSRNAARHFRRLYLAAFSLIAGLAITGQVLVQRSLNSQLNGSHIVNQAGAQRMLSQRISLKILLHDGTQSDAPAQLREIAALRDRWVAAHAALVPQVEEVAYDRAARTALAGLLDNLHQPLQRMAALVDRLVAKGSLSPAERREVLTDQEIFLPLMDAVVLGVEQSVSARVAFLQNLELGLLVTTLVVLVLEAVLVFRPAVLRLEASLAQLEHRGRQAARRLQSLRHLAGGIAHSFNNILTGILGHAQLQRMDAQASRQSTEFIDAQIEGGRRAAEIVSQLLLYSGQGRFDLQPTPLGPWLHDLALSFTPRGSPVAISVEVIEDSAAAVDRKAVSQAVKGLVANAVEAMAGRSGAVEVRLLQASLTEPLSMSGPYRTELPPGLYACIRVTDQGEGISAEELDHIFDPYHTRKQFGRGLGLAAILGIAHGHGGGIELASQPGCGTIASLYLPNSEVAGKLSGVSSPV
jgi:signal transduction histidine kinase